MKNIIFLITISFSLFQACSNFKFCNNSIPSNSLICIVNIDSTKLSLLKEVYNSNVLADSIPSDKDGNLTGFKTGNRYILENILKPAIELNRKKLEMLPQNEIINQMTILSFKVFQSLLQKDFYRWGGDLLDLDDPQSEGVRFRYKYGLDCSGFAVSGYELAVESELIDSKGILFSSKGYKEFCYETGFIDGGGINGTSNGFRLDTKELDRLGTEVLRIEKNQEIKLEDVAKLRAGDIVGRNGHFGIIVESGNILYYLESGGWVVPFCDGNPVEVFSALNRFSENGYVSVRRCLEVK